MNRLIDEDSKLIPAGRGRTLFLAGLMGVDVALAIVAASVPAPQLNHAQNANSESAAAVKTLKAYAKKPRLRARDAKTGKFVSVKYAKEHPDTTVIERVKEKR